MLCIFEQNLARIGIRNYKVILEFYRNNTFEILLAHYLLIFELIIAIAIVRAKTEVPKS